MNYFLTKINSIQAFSKTEKPVLRVRFGFSIISVSVIVSVSNLTGFGNRYRAT